MELKAIRIHSDSVILRRGPRNYVAKQISSSEFTLTNSDGRSLQAAINDDNSLVSNDEIANDVRVSQLLEEAVLGLGLRP